MLARKGGRAHRRFGVAYLGALALVCVSGIGLSIARPPGFPHLLALGAVAAALGAAGYAARRRRDARVHLLCMGWSYVAILTAFYVDNGPRLPLWRLLPPIAFWVLPTLVAVPLLVRALRRHGGRTRGY
jgi:hypothetical protein